MRARTGRPRKRAGERAIRVVAYVQPDVARILESFAREDGDANIHAWAARRLARIAREGI